jgi:hypothetical protein
MHLRRLISGLCGVALVGLFWAQSASASNSVSDGTRSLTVSQSANLSGDGQSVTVSGSGYDTNKGIYVALCVATPAGVLPSPCGGGVDMEGDGGASVWISDNPPSYASGLPISYGPGGTFRVSFKVGPIINSITDCRVVRCAIVTKNDHTINNDRSQDLQIPVTFTGTPVATTVPKNTTTTTKAGATTVPGAAVVTESQGDVEATPYGESATSDTTLLDDVTSEATVTEITVADNVDDLVAVSTSNESSRPNVLAGLSLVMLLVVAGVFFAARRRKQ